MTDIKQICANIIELLDTDCDIDIEINELRAALTEPEPEGATDQELLEVIDRATADFPPNHPEAEPMTGARYALTLELRKARAVEAAVLARWGRPAPQPPVDGEVAELVAAVQATYSAYGWVEEQQFVRLFDEVARLASNIEEGCNCSVNGPMDWQAEIEQMRQHPQPVPVSERLKQMEDLAADAVSALRYIEQSHGRLYGVGWDRVYEKADHLKPSHGVPAPLDGQNKIFK